MNISIGASITIMIVLGGLYAWSSFVPLLKAEGVSTAFTQLVFGIIIAILPLSMAISGVLIEYTGIRLTALLTSILFGSGYILASVPPFNKLRLLLGIGVMGGIATGLGYIIGLNVPVVLLPEKRGLMTGIATSGFGAGAILLSYIIEGLQSKLNVLEIFRLLGTFYGLMLFSAALLLPPNVLSKSKKVTGIINFKHVIKNRKFWASFLGMFTGSFVGLGIIGNLKPIFIMRGVGSYGSLGISILAIGNAMGRIFWGYFADKKGFKLAVFMSLSLLSMVTFILILVKSLLLLILNAFLIGLCFGATFSIYAALISKIFGIANLKKIYPYLIVSYAIAGLTGPPINGYLYDLFKSYTSALFLNGVLGIVGTVVVMKLGVD